MRPVPPSSLCRRGGDHGSLDPQSHDPWKVGEQQARHLRCGDGFPCPQGLVAMHERLPGASPLPVSHKCPIGTCCVHLFSCCIAKEAYTPAHSVSPRSGVFFACSLAPLFASLLLCVCVCVLVCLYAVVYFFFVEIFFSFVCDGVGRHLTRMQ